MHATVKGALGEAAVGAGDHVLAPQQVGKPRDAFGDQLRMLDDVGGVADDPGNEHFAVRQLGVLPHLPLVLVARIRRLDHVGAGAHLEDEIDNVLERDVTHMRPWPAPPAHVIAHAILGDSLERAVQRFDELAEPAPILLEGAGRDHAVVRGGRARIVDLQD
jgi:hypothetical protein